MDYKTVNLKENMPSVEQALAIFEIEIEKSKLEGVKAVKVLHGYGSHGKGGDICKELRILCFKLKKQKKIKDYLLGNEWDMSCEKCINLLTNLKDCYNDEDLNHANPGITIVVL